MGERKRGRLFSMKAMIFACFDGKKGPGCAGVQEKIVFAPSMQLPKAGDKGGADSFVADVKDCIGSPIMHKTI